jgi:integrase
MGNAIRLAGTHRVTKRLKDDGCAIYWYRFRGGPLLMRFAGATRAEALKAEIAAAADLTRRFYEAPVRPEPRTMHDLVVAYRAAPDGYAGLAASTKTNWARWLDEIDEVFGKMPLSALAARGPRSRFIKWRDTRASQARTADYGMQVLKRLLSFGVGRELIDKNPAEGIKGLYQAGNRSEKIVTDEELRAILGQVTREAGRAIRLAAATGMRRGDLIALRWSDVHENALEFGTSKSGGRYRALVPLHEDGLAVVQELREERARRSKTEKVASPWLLTSARGAPWAKDSLTQAFWRAASDLGIKKDLHDLRGTAITRFIKIVPHRVV